MSTSSLFVSSTVVPVLLTLPPLYFLYSLVFPSIASLPTAGSQLASSHHEAYNWAPLTGPRCLLLKDYTPRELAKFDGRQADNGRILLAIKGQVFDVSAGRNFYGPGACAGGREAARSPRRQALAPPAGLSTRPADDLSSARPTDGAYGNFAGRDASRGMAKQSFDEGLSASLARARGPTASADCRPSPLHAARTRQTCSRPSTSPSTRSQTSRRPTCESAPSASLRVACAAA